MADQPPSSSAPAPSAAAQPSSPNEALRSSSTGAAAADAAAKAAPKRNPAFAAMGLPRLRLPSRNWTIFLSVVAGWTLAVQYDRREKRIAHEKWARLVSRRADEPLAANALPRRVTVVLAAPPADGLMSAREHFHEYVKPVLVSAALDWDAVEGRREGDVRAGVAEGIRKKRMMTGNEVSVERLLEVFKDDVEPLIEEIRDRGHVDRWKGIEGNLVIGRHSWKEYVRGLHEGWLGPVEEPGKRDDENKDDGVVAISSPKEEAPTALDTLSAKTDDDPLMLGNADDDASPTAAVTTSQSDESSGADAKPEAEQAATSEEDKKKPKKRKQPEPFIASSAYSSAALARICPDDLGPSAIIAEPHLLGFFNFPTRIYRYLTKRRLADDIGRQVAAAALGHYRSFESGSGMEDDVHGNSWTPESAQAFDNSNGQEDKKVESTSEQDRLLKQEEPEWHKSVKKRDEDLPGKERVWLDPMVLEPRIAGRMRRFELLPEDEAEAARIEIQIREERNAKLWDIPSRIGRGLIATLGYGPSSQDNSALATVGNAEQELD